MTDAFDDLFTANDAYAATFASTGLSGTAARGLAVLTCIDSRIDPLAALGLSPGDAKIIRNAGARVTPETLVTLVLAVYLLGVNRIFVMPHTDCGVAKVSRSDIDDAAAEYDIDTRGLDFPLVSDQQAALRHGLSRIRDSPYLPDHLTADGAFFDVATGKLTR